MAAAITVRVKPLTGDAVEIPEVRGDLTVGGLRAVVAATTEVSAQGFCMYKGKKYLADGLSLDAAGVTDGTYLSMSHRPSLKERAATRVTKLGNAARSTKHDIRVSKEDVIDAVTETHQETQNQLQGLAAMVSGVHAIMQGAEAPQDPTQPDRARLKQLRLQKRAMDNEISDLREREAERCCKVKRERAAETIGLTTAAEGQVQLAAETLLGNADIDAKRQELKEQHKAQLQVLNKRTAQLKAADRAATRAATAPKARAGAKTKAKAKA